MLVEPHHTATNISLFELRYVCPLSKSLIEIEFT